VWQVLHHTNKPSHTPLSVSWIFDKNRHQCWYVHCTDFICPSQTFHFLRFKFIYLIFIFPKLKSPWKDLIFNHLKILKALCRQHRKDLRNWFLAILPCMAEPLKFVRKGSTLKAINSIWKNICSRRQSQPFLPSQHIMNRLTNIVIIKLFWFKAINMFTSYPRSHTKRTAQRSRMSDNMYHLQ
jgi:hypothetical protein